MVVVVIDEYVMFVQIVIQTLAISLPLPKLQLSIQSFMLATQSFPKFPTLTPNFDDTTPNFAKVSLANSKFHQTFKL